MRLVPSPKLHRALHIYCSGFGSPTPHRLREVEGLTAIVSGRAELHPSARQLLRNNRTPMWRGRAPSLVVVELTV